MKLIIPFKSVPLIQGIPEGSDLWEMWRLAIEMHCWNIPAEEIQAELKEFEGCFNNGDINWKMGFTEAVDIIMTVLRMSVKQDQSALLSQYDNLTLDDFYVIDADSLMLEFNHV